MSAVEQPSAPEPSRGQKLVDRHAQQISKLVEDCRESEELTQTPGWRRLFTTNRDTHAQNEKAFLSRLMAAVEVLKRDGSSEEIEKEIKDCVKLLAEERERHQASMIRYVDPHRIKCERLKAKRDDVIREAREREELNPLHDRGIREETQVALREFPVAEWDEEGGTVTLS